MFFSGFVAFRKEMARTDATRQKALCGGGREAEGDSHAGAPELQVPAASEETRKKGPRGPRLTSVGDKRPWQ